jgi:hypothetical protein
MSRATLPLNGEVDRMAYGYHDSRPDLYKDQAIFRSIRLSRRQHNSTQISAFMLALVHRRHSFQAKVPDHLKQY